MTIVVVLVLGAHFYLDTRWTVRTETFYIVKDCISIMVLFVILPAVVIVKNKNMKNHLVHLCQPILTYRSIFQKNIIAPC